MYKRQVVERVVVVARVVVVVECSSGCGAGSPMMVRVLNPAGQMSLMAVVVVVERVVVSTCSSGTCSSSSSRVCSSGCGVGSPMTVRVMNPAGQMSLMAVVVVVERVVVSTCSSGTCSSSSRVE